MRVQTTKNNVHFILISAKTVVAVDFIHARNKDYMC